MRVMVAKLTRLTQKIEILWHLVAESCTTAVLGPHGESGNFSIRLGITSIFQVKW
jgi:hypothetical protein